MCLLQWSDSDRHSIKDSWVRIRNVCNSFALVLFSPQVVSRSFAIPEHRAPLTMDFLGRNTGMGCSFLLQGIFLTQGSAQVSCIGRWILYHWATRETLAWYIISWTVETCNEFVIDSMITDHFSFFTLLWSMNL